MTTTSPPTPQALLTRINTNAARDNIDFTVLPFHKEALDSITKLHEEATTIVLPDFTNATKIDTHTHPVPSWFRTLELSAAGRETPSWNVTDHLAFMSARGIRRSILSVSTPQANAFASPSKFERDAELRKKKTVALARLLNEYAAEVCRIWPERFSWLGVTALPFVEESVREVGHALGLGAVGISILTNAEGLYPGDAAFTPLWRFLEERAGRHGREVVFIHPTDPVIALDDGTLISSRPSPLRSGLGEFYFETARALSSLIASSPPYNSTLLKYPSLHWRISHGAGAFPDISERFLLGFPNESAAAREAYKTRCWYDSAGPVWPRQIKGVLEGMGVGVGQCVFGTDYPYGIGFWDVDENIAGLADAGFIPGEEREGVLWRNARELWRGKIAL
ncbi:amidohydrolase 2 [Didymella exigua CBS 183.55]|uniref:Amidohydrolase 2 n=1 Tax=Didymella exigua CBS 183.55 TaxID=1150837 RepID=A0A6A5S459_9PLEO|nr:amidohydrolase 2 [Didymella exigua CBS 183.55]KAF1934380.1 amidohydrolase 2 [Didymella exigua CBS 183.55]